MKKKNPKQKDKMEKFFWFNHMYKQKTKEKLLISNYNVFFAKKKFIKHCNRNDNKLIRYKINKKNFILRISCFFKN